MGTYQLDATGVTIRRFNQKATEDKPALDRMVFSFTDELGNKVTCRVSNEAAEQELERYITAGVAEKLTSLSEPAGNLVSGIRNAQDIGLAQSEQLAEWFSEMGSQLKDRTKAFRASDKEARRAIKDTIDGFVSDLKNTGIVPVEPEVEAPAPPPVEGPTGEPGPEPGPEPELEATAGAFQ